MQKKFNFTKAEIDSLPLPESGKRDTYHDAKTNGLSLRVSSTGVKTFCVFKRIKCGNPERVTLGRYPEMTIDQARRKAMETNIALSDGKNPAEIKRKLKSELLFKDLFAEYIERHSKLKKKTWDEDLEKYRNHLENTIGKKRLSEIDRRTIATIHSSITKQGCSKSKQGSPIAANRTLALISSVFGWAISSGLTDTNPALGIRRNREKSRDRFIQSDELPRFFQALADEPNETVRDYVLISLLTGARRSNVCSMRWKDISFDRAEWRIEETKNNTPQTVTLSLEAIEVLKNRIGKNESEFVFPGRGKLGHLVEPRKGWERILERAGIENLRLHDLRRTLGSWQAKTGASLPIIGKSLNHKNQSTTAIYARLDLDPVRESVSTATSAMLTAAGLSKPGKVIQIDKKKAKG
ncbi:Site-specific recombinase XerD [Nitrosomonas marina]|uniref:Site-specific recombinase XerD n=1 Tax=Nitrosomonas marina TaxID=917 RepID=A0A1I0EHF1_9PROT|nr:site-specific integrase [Nitrosomonas marina]SET44760.1 Site-specific recombinase XerD [Nitrosomonas marina]